MSDSSLPYFECRVGHKIYKILIDTGSNRNYIQPTLVTNPKPNEKPFRAVTVGGSVEITHYKLANLFNHPECNVKFFLLPNLRSFDAILGNDSLKDLEAVIDVARKVMTIKGAKQIPIKEKRYEAVNIIIPRTEHLDDTQKLEIDQPEISKSLCGPK